MSEEPYRYPRANASVDLNYHNTPWFEFVEVCRMVAQKRVNGVKGLHIKAGKGRMHKGRDLVLADKSDPTSWKTIECLKASSNVWVSWEIGNIDHNYWWNCSFQEEFDNLEDMGVEANQMWAEILCPNGEEPSCSVHAFLMGRVDYMDFDKEEEEEE
tara:strand:- start:2311 stop:2781 length:471 start_codon:yes stop_codon:yes gene_type:complete